jgi:pilus assembly protein TadC
MAMLYEMIGRLFSRRRIKQLGALLESAGMDFIPEAFAGFMVLICLLASFLLYLFSISFDALRNFLFKLAAFVSFDLTVSSTIPFTIVAILFSLIVAGGGILLAVYVLLILRADSRRRSVEEALPDFLSLAASNVRAGMTIDQAMWYAAKPEFGILSKEVTAVSKKAFGGVPFNQAIDHLSERFNSKPMKRAVALIKQGMASGGQLADILERTAEDSRQMSMLRKEISAALLMYAIFIVFAGAIGTPLLFAISSRLVAMLEGVFASLPSSGTSSVLAMRGGPFVVPAKPAVSSSDFFLFTILSCIITAIFSALIIGVIYKGSKKDGVPYIPALLIFSLIVFFLTSMLLEGALANFYI